MGKKSRVQRQHTASAAEGEVAARQPCPCGSGKRFKACHGSGSSATAFVARPFAGLAGECDLIALRELVAAATVPLRLKDSDRTLKLVTLLPGGVPAMVRENGDIWLALQVRHNFGDVARDLGAVIEAAMVAEPGSIVGLTDRPGPGPRLQDLIVDAPLEITVEEGFGYWVADFPDLSHDMEHALEDANDSIWPSQRLAGVDAAYWTNVGSKEHLRWVMPEPESELLDALAKVYAAGEASLIPEGRLVGMFRAHGLLAPVWDLPVGTGAEVLEAPAKEFYAKLQAALKAGGDLTAEERAAKAGLSNRQVTIR